LNNVRRIAKQVHRTRAVAVIGDDPVCAWLMDKPEILDELGRIDTDFAVSTIARRLCEIRPDTYEAINMIRRHRSFDKLADELVKTVTGYLRRYPATTRSEIKQALDNVALRMGTLFEQSEPGKHQFLRKAGASR
jgi:hypothetical protein